MEHLFSSKNLTKVDLALVANHPKDPFKPYSEGKLRELADSIAEFGLLEPVCLRKTKYGKYEILAGKNRANATRLLGKTEIDAFVFETDDETAVMIITDSNLKHRDKLLPSERGFAYRLQLDAIKKQGKRSDLAEDGTSSQIETKLTAAEKIAVHHQISRADIYRYIRITYLVPELLELVDAGFLPMAAGVDLSYLQPESQRVAYKFFYVDHINSIDIIKSGIIKRYFKDQKEIITPNDLENLFYRRKRKVPDKPFSISRKKLSELVNELPDNDTLERMFYQFLAEKLGARGTAEIKRVSVKQF